MSTRGNFVRWKGWKRSENALISQYQQNLKLLGCSACPVQKKVICNRIISTAMGFTWYADVVLVLQMTFAGGLDSWRSFRTWIYFPAYPDQLSGLPVKSCFNEPVLSDLILFKPSTSQSHPCPSNRKPTWNYFAYTHVGSPWRTTRGASHKPYVGYAGWLTCSNSPLIFFY